MSSLRLAVVDVGTLKVKAELVEVSRERKITPIHRSNTLTCLGVRMNENNNQPFEENIQKTIRALQEIKDLLKEKRVKKVRLVSTHALREMGDTGKRVAERINKEIGLEIEIINQKAEAELFFKAVMKDFTTDQNHAVIDVGGGSVQILIGNRQELKSSFLLKLGAQYLHDNFSPRHNEEDFPTEKEMENMRQHILKELSVLPENINTPLVYGSSCIIDVFKALRLNLEDHSASPTHPYKTNFSGLEELLKTITPIPYKERGRQYPFDQKYYMWGIDKAFLLVTCLGHRLASPYVVTSNANINQGLLLDLIES
jgi:exopolyphosphatase/guanosine-5'-triphosphate,3'-diphosphate pyrophosphatase